MLDFAKIIANSPRFLERKDIWMMEWFINCLKSCLITPLQCEGGGIGSVIKGPLVLRLNANATEQRVSGGRLFIENARNLRTKVMSNGVEVIVRGASTGLVGYSKTPWLPQRVHPSKPVTLPGHTVSRQFHLKDNPGKMANGIGQLLQSIVRSATPDLVTKTLLTTFTYKTTILKRTNTIIKSHTEVVSNILTQRFQSLVKITPTLHPATTSLPPDFMLSYLATSPYSTADSFTTYIYYNTFTVGGLPMVITSRATVSNVATLPGYLSPTSLIRSTPAFETETHYSTYTFSKTVRDRSSVKIVTTRETVTQVVVTEGLAPVQSVPSISPASSGITYFTTFTHLQTALGADGELVVRSSTSILSSIVGGVSSSSSFHTPGPLTIAGTIAQTKTLTPVLLYATRVYFTTYTYFTTVRHKESDIPARVDSRTQVVSRVVTEALQTAFELSYVNSLKSSYLSKHSTLLDVVSSVEEIIPTRTIDIMEDLVTGSATLITQQVTHPHWPKDDDQLAVEVEPSTISSGVVQVTGGEIRIPSRPKPWPNVSRPPPTISSSEEHFDEVKEGVHKIVSVLTDTTTSRLQLDKVTWVRPTRTEEAIPKPTAVSGAVLEFEDFGYGVDAPDAYVEQVTSHDLGLGGEVGNDFTSVTELEDGVIFTERPVSHLPTPHLPLTTRIRTSTERSEPSSKAPEKPSTSKIPIMDQNVNLDLFPDIGPKPVTNKPGILVDYPHELGGDYDFPDDDELVPSSTTVSSSKWLDKRTGSGVTPSSGLLLPGVSPTKEILSLIAQLTEKDKDPDEDNSDEETQPPKIYNIPATFDTEGFNQQQKEQDEKLNNTILHKELSNSTEIEVEADSTTLPEVSESEEDDDHEENTTTAEVDVDVLELNDDLNDALNTSSPTNFTSLSNSSLLSEDIPSIAEDSLLDISDEIEDNTTPTPEETDAEDSSNTTTSAVSDEVSITEPPSPIEEIVEKLEPQPSSQLDDLFNSEELAFISTGGYPTQTTTRYTTSRRPTKKNTSSRPAHPFGGYLASGEETSGESSTHVYALGPVRFPSKDSSEEESSLSEDYIGNKKKKNKVRKKHKPSKDSVEEDSQESEEDKKTTKRKPHHPLTSYGSYSGPSKSAISFPVAAAGAGGAAIASQAFNWKPLLSLGAVGLGGLGASTLTKLGPLFNSVAGYMKGAILPISRNDTQHNNKLYHQFPKRVEKGRRPYYQGPIFQEPPPHGLSEPIYIPLGGVGEPEQKYRFTDDSIIRRPVLTTAPEPNFRPLANGREPDFVSGPLPPPIMHSYGHSEEDGMVQFPRPDHASFPPKHNYNFAPPNDNLPNIFEQSHSQDKESQPSLHKHGDPSPEPFLEDNHPHHDSDGPEGKTGFILRPLQNLFNGKPQRPGWVTPVLRPHQNQDPKPPVGQGHPPMLGPIYKPRPGPASIEMINEIRDTPPERPSYDTFHPPAPQLFLPQRNKPQINSPRPEGPLRINIPGLNLHSGENDVPEPWHPKTPQDRERFAQNPFKDGGGPPHLTRNKQENAASSHESFDQDNFGGRDHFNEIVTRKPVPIRPPMMRPISPFHRPPVLIQNIQQENQNQGQNPDQNKHFFGESTEKFRPEDHQTSRPPFNPMSAGYFDFDPPKFNLESGAGPTLDRPSHYNKGQNGGYQPNPARLPPWPNSGPGPGQLPGRFPSPMNIFDAPELKPQPIPQPPVTILNINPENNNIQRIVDPPHIRRPPNPPSTVYIVEEQLHEDDDLDEDDNFIKNHKFGVKPNFQNVDNHQNPEHQDPNQNSNRLPLIIKEVPTTSSPTSTTTLPPINTNTTNRALISRLFIRRFTTTTPSPPHQSTPYVTRVLPPWASKPKMPQFAELPSTSTTTTPPPSSTSNMMKDLLNFEEKFKQKYGPRKNTNAQPAGAASSHSHVVNVDNHRETYDPEDEELNVSIYSDETESQESPGFEPGSLNNHQLHSNDTDSHPNHHPIHKPPIDVTKYLKDVDEDEFGQLYQGTEDKEEVIDPSNGNKVVKRPEVFGVRRNFSVNSNTFSRRTTAPPQLEEDDSDMATTEHYSTLSESQEDVVLKKFTVPADLELEFTSTPPGNSNLWWPTTFRPKSGFGGDSPTTYRPHQRPLTEGGPDIVQTAASNTVGSQPRPAPQGGMASFYDDEESMGQIKMKNKEIHKLPSFTKRPGSGIALVRPGGPQEYEKSTGSVSVELDRELDREIDREIDQAVQNIRDKLNKEADKIQEYPEFPEQDISGPESYENKPSLATTIQVVRPHTLSEPKASPPQKSNGSSTLVVVTTSGKTPGKESQLQIQVDQEGTHAPTGNRESSYIYEEEYYDEDDDKSFEVDNGVPLPPPPPPNNPQGKIVFFPKKRPPPPPLPPNFHHIAGHKVNFPRLPLHNGAPPRYPHRPIIPGGDGLRIFQQPQPSIPKTEMEPPPIDSNRLKAPILELPSSGPIRTKYRPSSETKDDQDDNSIHRPNLLRPESDLFAKDINPTPVPTPPVIHTIASLDEFNKIVGTNTFTAMIGSGERGTRNQSSNSLEGSEVVTQPPTETRVSSVIKYTGGRLQTSTALVTSSTEDEEEDDDYYEEVTTTTTPPPIVPSRSSILRGNVIQKTRGPSLAPKNLTLTTPPTTANTTRPNPRTRPPLLRFTTKTPSNLSSTTAKPIIRRPFIPTRGPGPNIVPWARRPQPSSTTIVPKTLAPETNNTRNRTVFSSTISDRDKRPTTTVIVTTSTSNSSSEAKKYSPSSNIPPFLRRPGGGSRTSSSEEKRKVTTLVSRFVPTSPRPTTTLPTPRSTTTTSTPASRPPSIFQNVSTTTAPSNLGSGSDEYEEYSYEEDVELGLNATATPPSSTQQPTNATSKSTSTSTSISISSHNSSEINPTRTFGPRWRSSSSNKNSALSSEVEVTVRYVTRSESVTLTLTETELHTLSSSGYIRTQTILITRTIPPETLVSTIAGDVTLVNTLQINPTVVRTTVTSEPTRAPDTPSFVDSSSENSVEDETETPSTERVALSGLITKGNRPGSGNIVKRPGSTPSPSSDSIPCSTNCTLNPNHNLVCRTFANGTRSRCDCKPGYARIKSKYACRPTFTYEMQLGINHMDGMLFDFKDLYNAATDGYLNFITITKEAIDKAFLSTDIKRQFQGSEVLSIAPVRVKNGSSLPPYSEPKVNVDFLVQLTTNITEDRIKNHLIRTLRTSNFSIGRTGVTSTRDFADFAARDFNECQHSEWNDCSVAADCLNIRGSFSCQCKPGFKDKSGSKRKPGRDCQETTGCQECSFRGTCHREGAGNRTKITCHCFKWYGGTTCQINLKFLLIAVTGIGSVLFILVMLCGTLLCKRTGSTGAPRGGTMRRPERTGSGRFMRYRSPNSQTTLERTAIMHDSGSSDGRQSPHHVLTHGHGGHNHHHSFTPDSLLVDVPDPNKISGFPLPGGGPSRHHSSTDVNLINFSLRNVVLDSDHGGMAVVIPRAKIKTPSRPPSTSAAYGIHSEIPSPPDLAAAENKLINYLDQNQSGCGHASKFLSTENQLRKYSLQEQRKMSQGALVSSGEAVSAIGGMRRRSTTALDPTLESPYSAYTKSVSEVRSYNETIRCAAKPPTLYNPTDTASRGSCYSCKPPSYCGYSESHGHTMGDKDGASTVYTTQGKLFRMAHHHQQDDASSTASSQ